MVKMYGYKITKIHDWTIIIKKTRLIIKIYTQTYPILVENIPNTKRRCFKTRQKLPKLAWLIKKIEV